MRAIFHFIKRVYNFFYRKLKDILYAMLMWLPYFHFIKNTVNSQSRITLRIWFMQKVLGFNKNVYWPVHFTSKINQYKHILVGVDTTPGIEPGCYIQGIGKVYIGDYVRIAQNVGIISSNHDLYDAYKHDLTSEVHIGSYSWLGMNSVILPNVTLGDFTIVGAGAVVTKSFPDGYCVIGGNPAKVIKLLEIEKCVRYHSMEEYVGYMKKEDFIDYRKNNLWV